MPSAVSTATHHARTPAKSELEAKRAASRREAQYDAELVRRFNAGDEAAFNEIVSRYREKMYCIALSLLRNSADAEEIVQDTFVRAYRGMKKFRGDSSLVTWLHRITLNLARNRYWYFYRRKRHAMLSLDCPLADVDVPFGDLIASDVAEPARQVNTGEFVDLVEGCMDELQPSHREILTLRNALNRSYDEIAQALGIEVGTVKSRIARARGCLRALMAAKCPEFAADADPAEWLDFDRARTAPLVSRGS